MAGRRRKWVIAASLLGIAAALTWLATRKGPRVSLELSFVGYANRTVTYSNVMTSHGRLASFTTVHQSAQVLATNSGEVALKLNTRPREKNYVTIDGVWVLRGSLMMPLGSNPPSVLQPGETRAIEIASDNFANRWSTEVLAQPYRLRDRLAEKAATVPGAAMQMFSRKLSSPPDGVLFKLDTVTNRPPARPGSHFY